MKISLKPLLCYHYHNFEKFQSIKPRTMLCYHYQNFENFQNIQLRKQT